MESLRAFFDAAVGRIDDIQYPCSVLGRMISNNEELTQLLQDSFILLTYRMNFDPLPHSSVTSDKGWGCLARASQMLLAHTLHQHCKDDFKLEYFRDMDSPQEAPFSLHNMVRATYKKSGIFRPEYWPPSQGCEAIRCCVNNAVRRRLLSQPISVVVSSNGSIWEGEVRSHLLETGRVLILAPIRCGTSRRLTQMMFFSLEHLLHSPSCLGVVGGVPNRSYYIIGSSGQRLLFLDPHCMTQNALVSCDESDTGIVIANSSLVKSVRWDRVDTSFFLGFFVDSISKWEELQERIGEVRKRSLEIVICVISGNPKTPLEHELLEWPTEEELAEG